jgi:hypothetical protein
MRALVGLGDEGQGANDIEEMPRDHPLQCGDACPGGRRDRLRVDGRRALVRNCRLV